MKQRLRMAADVTRAFPQIQVMALEEAQFSVKRTLPQLQTMAGEAELTLLIGSDVAKSLKYWEGIEELAGAVRLIVGLRRHDTVEEVEAVMDALEHHTKTPLNFIVVDTPHRFTASSCIQKLGSLATVDFSV
jgi:nicotinic acid mononucleotide adenylyltransferase